MADDAMNRDFLELNDRLEAVTKGSFAQDKPAQIHFRFDASNDRQLCSGLLLFCSAVARLPCHSSLRPSIAPAPWLLG